MQQINSELQNAVRRRLLLCVRVSHGTVIDQNVFIEELDHVLSRVFALFFPEAEDQQRERICDCLRLEFQSLRGDEIKALVIKEKGYFRAIALPWVLDCVCWPLLVVLIPLVWLKEKLQEIKWIGFTISLIFRPLICFFDVYFRVTEPIISSMLPKSLRDAEPVTYNYLSWIPAKQELPAD